MSEEPEWWIRARELELMDRLEEAESAIKEGMAPQGYPWPAQVAQLYYLRMQRLLSAGDFERARSAATEAVNNMWYYAAGATSGGEGAALSYERDRFRDDVIATLAAYGIIDHIP